MSRVSAMQTAFNGGELSPLMLGRPDHEIWPVALYQMVGYAPRPQGPAESCPGFEFVDHAAGPGRLIAFEPYVTQGYVIEATDGLFRFYTNDVRLEVGGVPVEVATPYSVAQLAELDWEQSNDVMYLFHGEVAPRILVREAADSFSLQTIAFDNGPFLDRNADEGLTISFSGVTGTVTVTANNPLFAATDVGRLLEVEAHDLSDVSSWEPGITVTSGQLLQWDGRVYQVMAGGTGLRTGTVAPVHTRGVEWDGIGKGKDLNDKDAGGVQLLYMHDMFGRVRITGFTSATQVTATVTRRLPLQLASGGYNVGDYVPPWYVPPEEWDGSGGWGGSGGGTYTPGTWRWRLGAFSDTSGWPTQGVIWNQRLILAQGDRIYGSVAGDLLNFDRLNEFGEVSLDQAFTVQIDNPNPIRWMLAAADLFIGTAVSEHVLRPASAAQGIGPGNLRLERQGSQGSADLRPVEHEARPIFLQRNGERLLHMIDDTYGRYSSDDLTRYADHIANAPFIDLCWQREPMQLLWALRADGTLAAADYMPTEKVLGWFRRPLADGLAARGICSITSPDGRRDQVWAMVQKGNAWLVMVMAPWPQAGAPPTDLDIVLDGALTYDGGSGPIATLSLPHLAGEMVDVVGDGIWLGTFPVGQDGSVSLPEAVTNAVAGLPFPAYLEPLPFEGGGDNGPAQSKMKRIPRVTIRLQHSRGLAVTCQGQRVTELDQALPGSDLTRPLPALSEDVPIDIIGAWDRAGQIRIERTAPLRSTVLALIQTVEVSQR